MSYAKLWTGLTLVVLASFSVLGYYGVEIYRMSPPVPDKVVTPDGTTLFTGQDIKDGQNVWQSMGGQEVGTVWGHGAYVAPDWSADYLHRQATVMLDGWAKAEHGKPYDELGAEAKAALAARVKGELRTNTFDPKTRTVTVSADRAKAIEAVAAHYAGLFGDASDQDGLRKAYAISANAIQGADRQAKMSAFFFWAAWACSTERPGSAVSYTNNWPHEDLVGNVPSGSIVLWSILSVIVLLAGVGAMVWYYAFRTNDDPEHILPTRDPLLGLQPTPSMKATLKYFWVVAALLLTQVGLGAVTAHYGVEGQGFYGIPLAKWLPYSVTRTWHTQLGIFWIATAWLATGLFVAPAVSGREPKFQRAGVNFLFVCLLVIVVGSLAGQWFAIQQKLGLVTNFWFGHQGYEYVDLGRFWQIFLLVGLFVWLGLVVRALWPAFRNPAENKHLLGMFVVSSAAIGLFYGAGLMWGRQTNLAMAEYWRWWVIHLWVEGFFEVFATVVIAFLFTRMGLLRKSTATSAVMFSSTIFLTGGIIGTMHHLYFTGTPTAVLALGSVFSALEIVPLVLVGFEAYENYKLSRGERWVSAYKWPIYFFVAVAFWNFVGAGLFGFLINPPVALYYMQGLNTTAVHGHTALFGVYGMLGIGLMLFSLKGLAIDRPWKTGVLAFAFWSINIGLATMVLISLLPVGLMQAWASVEHGMWYARSAEFMQTPLMQTLRWMRVPGDTIFAAGIVALVYFIVGLKTGWSIARDEERIPVAATAKGKRLPA